MNSSAQILQTPSAESLRLVERRQPAPIAQLVYCGCCARMVGDYADFRCARCGREIWELRAMQACYGLTPDNYKPPRRCRQSRPYGGKRVAAQIALDLAQADTAPRRHRQKYREEF